MDVRITTCHLRPEMAQLALDDVVRHTQIDHSCSDRVAELMGLKTEQFSIRISYFTGVR
jgi:hypothetical protein